MPAQMAWLQTYFLNGFITSILSRAFGKVLWHTKWCMKVLCGPAVWGRTNLSENQLDQLVRINVDDPPIEKWDPSSALETWYKEKCRIETTSTTDLLPACHWTRRWGRWSGWTILFGWMERMGSYKLVNKIQDEGDSDCDVVNPPKYWGLILLITNNLQSR